LCHEFTVVVVKIKEAYKTPPSYERIAKIPESTCWKSGNDNTSDVKFPQPIFIAFLFTGQKLSTTLSDVGLHALFANLLLG
jgi:hypothetical protein